MPLIEDTPSSGNYKYEGEAIYRVQSYLFDPRKAENGQVINDAIELAREAYALTVENAARRLDACLMLVMCLSHLFQRYGNDGVLREMISLGREALTLSRKRHSNRALSCGNLATSLVTLYERIGDISLLDEAINLGLEALDLCPAWHPDRSMSCGNLATSLSTRYKCSGDVDLLNEAIDLEREALDLCPAGDQDRSMACGNLANLLMTRYQRTGNVAFLDEAVDLQREALHLRPTGDQDRHMSCVSLANSLKIRYKRTGDVALLEEAIDLGREALDLCPAGHPERSRSRGSLATSLFTRYKRTGDVALLDEAIDLEREALDLCPAGHPERSMSCGNLATSLLTRYKCSGDVDLLNEAIDLERETLDLCPAGHPERSMSCGNLATTLTARYQRTNDVASLRESLTLSQEAVTSAPLPTIWIHLHRLAWVLLLNDNPVYDVHKAILHLSQSLQHEPDDPLAFVLSLSSLLDKLWQCNMEGKHIQLTTIYQRLVSHLPLLIHPALGLQPQLQALKRCTQLGSDAFVNAALADQWSTGLETLELAQGVIWSTTLHRRDPQLKDVPEHLASKLQGLLQSLTISSAAQPDNNEWKSFISPRDLLHAQSSHFYAVIREIRAVPGLERFMLGESVDTLRTVASNHPVVILVSARGHHYALVMAPSTTKHALVSLDLTNEDERVLSSTKDSLRQSRGGTADIVSLERALKISALSCANALERRFEVLWEKVVKPVIEHLELKVSDRNDVTLRSC
jgi:hypothetical protein